MSVEALIDRVYSTKSDVWSFGVLCFEILFQKEPYEGLDAFTAGSKVAYKGLRLQMPDVKEWPIIHEIMKK